MLIHGDATLGKEVRFSADYALQELGNLQYKISMPLEIIKSGTDSKSCPSVPQAEATVPASSTPC